MSMSDLYIVLLAVISGSVFVFLTELLKNKISEESSNMEEEDEEFNIVLTSPLDEARLHTTLVCTGLPMMDAYTVADVLNRDKTWVKSPLLRYRCQPESDYISSTPKITEEFEIDRKSQWNKYRGYEFFCGGMDKLTAFDVARSLNEAEELGDGSNFKIRKVE
jgi:hypothetical protein